MLGWKKSLSKALPKPSPSAFPECLTIFVAASRAGNGLCHLVSTRGYPQSHLFTRCPMGHAAALTCISWLSAMLDLFLGSCAIVFPLCGEAARSCSATPLSVCRGGATCTWQKDAEVATIRTIPRTRNGRTRALPASAPGEAVKTLTCPRACSHLWGQHLLLGW